MSGESLESSPDSPLPPPFDDYYLSSLDPTDFLRLIDLYNNTDLAQILLTPPFPYTLQDAQWFHDNKARKPLPGFPGTRESWVVRSKSHDGILVGMCGTSPMPDVLPKYLRLGYWVAPEFRGKGIIPVVVTEVLKRFPGAIFEAGAETENIKSQRVLEKCGFQKVEGVIDVLDWPASRGGGVRNMFKYLKEC